MSPAHIATPKVLAVSDLHVAFPENREIVADLRPESAADWLLVAGDVGELRRRHRVGTAAAEPTFRHRRMGAGQP